MVPKILNITQAAAHCGIPKRTFFRMLEKGVCPVEPIPKSKPRKWLLADLDAWLAGK